MLLLLKILRINSVQNGDQKPELRTLLAAGLL
jgi:hypothetical protein